MFSRCAEELDLQGHEKGDRSRPNQESPHLSRHFMDGVVNLLSGLIVNLHVVLLTAMLLYFRHNLGFAVSIDLPVTVLRANVGAAEVKFLIAMLSMLSCHATS